MLIGSYLGVLSEKRRVAVPRKYLEELGPDLIIAKWFENCLVLVSSSFWDELFIRLTGGSKAKTYGVRDNERFILGSAFALEADDQGRIVVPEILSSYAKLEKEVYFVGLRDRVEIWAKEAWDQKNQTLSENARKSIEGLN